MTQARYLTSDEVNERLAEQERAGVKWWERAVPLWLFLAVIALGVFGVLFSIGLTLHEAYDAQLAMGEAVSPPPFNGFFESIHSMLAVAGHSVLAVAYRIDAWLWG